MKIGIVTTWFERGAAYVSKQFKEVWEKEHEVFIYARGGEKVAKFDSVWNKGNITYGKRYDYSNLDFIDLKHFESWIKNNNLDFVFFNEQHLWDPVLLCYDLKVKTGAYIDYYTDETITIFRLYDFLICNTKRHFSVFDWHPNVYYIPWGTNTKIFNSSQKKKSNENDVVFFHSAGMNPYRKGCDHVIRAFDRLNCRNSKLIIHTQSKITDFFPELKQEIKNLEKQGRLKVIHKTISAPGLYHLGDVYVYPSRLEGIGLTIAEASACGMPVITTNEAPMKEFIKNDVNGKLVDVKRQNKRRDGYYWKESEIDIDDLKNKMKFYVNNIKFLDQFKENSYLYAHENLDWDINSKHLLNIVEDISLIELKQKDEVYNDVQMYENKKSIWFYVANTKFYRRLKSFFVQFFKKIF